MTLRENAISVCCCFVLKSNIEEALRTSTPISPARYACTFSRSHRSRKSGGFSQSVVHALPLQT